MSRGGMGARPTIAEPANMTINARNGIKSFYCVLVGANVDFCTWEKCENSKNCKRGAE